MTIAEEIFRIFELVGTIAFAISGAMISIEKEIDLFGVAFLGLTTACGGGMLRDLLLGNTPPGMFFDGLHAAIAVATALAVFLLARLWQQNFLLRRRKIDRINNIIDAIGLGACSVTGVRIAMEAGFADNMFLVVSLGMITAVGGGMLRDLLLREIPFIFQKHIYALASILGACTYYLLQRWGAGEIFSMFAGTGATFILRILATLFQWNLPRALHGF